jgi:hypothetical protein
VPTVSEVADPNRSGSSCPCGRTVGEGSTTAASANQALPPHLRTPARWRAMAMIAAVLPVVMAAFLVEPAGMAKSRASREEDRSGHYA